MLKKAMLYILLICLIITPYTGFAVKEESETITRAEFANVLMDTYEYITQEFSLPISETLVFDDIHDSEFSYRILQAYVNKFMFGVGDNKFMPNGKLNKCEATMALYRITQALNAKYNIKQENHTVIIDDITDVPIWGREAVLYMVANDIMPMNNGKFMPYSLITKGEVNNTVETIKKMFVTCDNGEHIDFQTFLERMTN